MTLTFVWRSFKVTPTIAASISLKLLELETSNLVGLHGFVWGMPSERTDNFPKSRCGLGHVTPTILAYVRTSSKLLALMTSTLVHGFVLPLLLLTVGFCSAYCSLL